MTQLNEFLQTIRDRILLSGLISRYVILKKRGREYAGLCPFHQEKGASFTVNDEKNFYHCFGCGAHGDHFGFLMQRLNLPFMEAVEFLAHESGLTMPNFSTKPAQLEKKSVDATLYEVMEAACQFFEKQLREPEMVMSRDYLKTRGLYGKTVQQFRLGYAGASGLRQALLRQGFSDNLLLEAGLLIQPENGRSPYERFRDRLMFPIQDIKGRIIAFGGRILDKGEPKYLNSPDTPLFNKGNLLYAHHYALPQARAGQPYIIVEGYMDAISLHQAGLASAVAPLGTALTTEQIRLLWRSCPTPILCFDGDAAGLRAATRAAQRALEVVRSGYSLAFCFLPRSEDPDSYVQKQGVQNFRQLLAQSRPLIEVLWQQFMSERLLQTPEQKAQARRELLTLSQQIQDQETQHFYREDLMQRLNKEIARLRQQPTFAKVNQKNLLLTASRNQGSKNKIYEGHKILLATLINHPTLIPEISEQLMGLEIDDQQLDDLRHCILDLCQIHPHNSADELIAELRQRGFNEIVAPLLSRDMYLKAPFSQPQVESQQALKSWWEVWQVIEVQQQLKSETQQTAVDLKTTLDQESWARLKHLKSTLEVGNRK